MGTVIASTYEVIGQIGSGGGGNVFLATHLRLGKKVVLKADKRKLKTRPEILRREVDILKDLRHSYIPQVYDFFVENGIVYTVMDFIEGESLDKPLKRGERFSQPQVIKWAKQILEALCYLHSPIHGEMQRGFVHSDIKPANLMRTPTNDICLIDFNIALALGEENIVGRSAGYASPEHYGLDYSIVSGNDKKKGTETETVAWDDETVPLGSEKSTVTISGLQSRTSLKKSVPDVRSDIYSVGATLYHLLSGRRPEKFALEVIPLTVKECSPQVIKIISKAMNPNPNLRYQTAAEMLYDFSHLHDNDSRSRRLKQKNRIAYGVLAVLFGLGIASTFIGLKRMQEIESRLKLAEYAQNALAKGDVNAAIQYSLDAIPEQTGLFTPRCVPEAQKALTDALGVYNLADGYKQHGIITIPKNPLYLVIAPDGLTAACLSGNTVVVIDTQNTEILTTLPSIDSALAEIKYLNNDMILYAGDQGISAYCISKDRELWRGEPATAISISRDGRTAAAVYKDESQAIIYDALTGTPKSKVDFKGRKQSVTMVSDSFANPNQNIFSMNEDGTRLAVSFEDGSLYVYNLEQEADEFEILKKDSGYTYFEGGFYKNHLAFSASDSEKSIFAVIDAKQKKQTVGLEAKSSFHARTDKNGIYVQTQNILVKVDPVTGDQTPLVTTDQLINEYAVGDRHTVIATEDKIMFFDTDTNLITEYNGAKENAFLQLAGDMMLSGRIDTPEIQILKYEDKSQEEILKYDPSFEHKEARISADGETVMLFSYRQFRIYDRTGNVMVDTMLPDSEQVYNQEFIREGTQSYLEVTYADGRIIIYDARNGEIISERSGKIPDMSLDEEFQTESFRIEAPLHGAPVVYDIKSGKKLYELKEDAYLTYVTECDDYIIAQYFTAEGKCYGVLMNQRCETLAYLPYLSDIADEKLYFDYPIGTIRKTGIYDLESLVEMASKRSIP